VTGKEPEVIISIKERVLNEALSASFYANQGDGLISLLSRALQIDGSNRGMRLIDPPMVALLGDGTIMATFGAEAWAALLGTRFDADVSASVRLGVWMEGGEAFMEFRDMELDRVVLSHRIEVPRFALSMMEGILRGALSKQAAGPMVRSMPVPTIAIPAMTAGSRGLEARIGSLAIHDGELVLGASSDAGEVMAPGPSAHPHEVAVRISESFLERLLTDAWEHAPHVVNVSDRIDVPDPRSLLDVFKEAVDVLLGRGLGKGHIKVDRSWVEADAEIQYGCPNLRLLEGGRVEIEGCPLHIGARLRPKMVAATSRGFLGWLKGAIRARGRDGSEDAEVIDIAELSEERDLRIVKATARLFVDDGELAVKIEDIDLDMELDWGLPGDLVERLSTWIMEQVLESFPPVRLKLPLQNMIIPVLGVTPSIRLDGLESGDGYLDVYADLAFTEVPPPISPLPRFLADRELKLVHRDGCLSAHLIPENAKIGYFSLYDAMSDGYRGCPDCLSVYGMPNAPGEMGSGDPARQVLKRV